MTPVDVRPPERVEPRLRLAGLFDAGSFEPLGEPDGTVAVVAGLGRVEGRPVVAYAQDASLSGGSVGVAEADVVVSAIGRAREGRLPVVGFFESAGARLQEGAAALGGYGRIFRATVAHSGVAPQLSVITGTSAGGGCYSPALTDFIVMTRSSAMFLTGPKIVQEAVGEVIDTRALGGPRVHERTGVCDVVAADGDEAVAVARQLLGHLAAGVRLPAGPAAPAGDPSRHVPAEARLVYDVRDVVGDLVDADSFLELTPRWARNLVVGFARLDGRSVGIVANQPRHLGGVLDVGASAKGARFVNACQRFGVPLVVLVDTPGFMPGSGQEQAGIIREGAELVRAFAAATVPRFTVVLRKAFGGAYITMNSKDLGSDLSLAWEGSQIGIMGAQAAVGLLHRRELADAPAERADALAVRYAEDHIAVAQALRLGAVDEVVAPADTRARLVRALREHTAEHGRHLRIEIS